MADLDPALVQQIFYIAERRREPDVEHHRQTNDLRARLELAKRGAFRHAPKFAGRSVMRQVMFL